MRVRGWGRQKQQLMGWKAVGRTQFLGAALLLRRQNIAITRAMAARTGLHGSHGTSLQGEGWGAGPRDKPNTQQEC